MVSPKTTLTARPDSDDPKRTRILEGALNVFLAYGFSRTTMDDIAKAAEISRPALYLVFRNKTDIYRALTTQFLNEALTSTQEVLEEDKPFAERLDRMCSDVFFCMIDEVESTPHGSEILDMKNKLAGDIIADWRGSLDDALAGAIDREAMQRGVDLEALGVSAVTLSSMLFDALDGMKTRVSDPRAHLEGAKRLLKVIDAVLRP